MGETRHVWRAYLVDLAVGSVRLLRADAALYLAILAYTICGLLLLDFTGRQQDAAYAVYLDSWTWNFLIAMPAIALLFDVFMVIHRFDGRRRLAFRRRFSPKRLAHLLSGMGFLAVFLLFQGTFTSLKNALPAWEGGFGADRTLADLDRWLHFGKDPWHYLYAFAGNDSVRRAIEFNYNVLWFVICFGALFFVVTSPRAAHVRTRYLVAFMMVWIVCGNLLAGMLLSAGPAFYGSVTGDEQRFAGQVAFLDRSAGLFSSAADYQHYLWAAYSTGRAAFGSGISAFPSVHVGMITMNALFLAESFPRLRWPAFFYVAFIMASSVYLGWHYAVDGYASVLIVTALHMLLKRAFAARAARRNPSGSETKNLGATADFPAL